MNSLTKSQSDSGSARESPSSSSTRKLPVSIIILAYNEEKNIKFCLESVVGLSDEIFIVDSFSTDGTLQIGKSYTDKIFQHPFSNYGHQRNWAQSNLPIKNEWVLHLDADERLTPELADEIRRKIGNVPTNINGFLIKKKAIFLGRWIRHGGHYPVYHLRLFRKDRGRCENRKYDQHFICEGNTLKLDSDLIEENNVDLTAWTSNHNRWATAEAQELAALGSKEGQIKEAFLGSPIERRRWLKNRIFKRSPLFVRSFLYFVYRYFLRLGFLDGKEGLIFHFLQGLWFRFLVDAKIYELKRLEFQRKKIQP
jgi:glycosyltransferase involved in cell wall biosynthesis